MNNCNITTLNSTDMKLINKPTKEQVIDNKVITIFRNEFGNIDKYLEHMKTLWILRDLVYNQMDDRNATNSNLYPAFHTLNEIIGVLTASNRLVIFLFLSVD